ESGGHLASARRVATGQAEIAALDAVTWRLIQRHEGFAADLRVLSWTEPTPGLPYIAALGVDQPAMFDALKTAIAALEPDDRDALGIHDLIAIAPQDYLAVPNPPDADS
ncbi:MAG: PhnD/SsuA/transferrin family substrate-binding protein, partial [Paracoccaceae bacterium]